MVEEAGGRIEKGGGRMEEGGEWRAEIVGST
jgi:hypothetical protein